MLTTAEKRFIKYWEEQREGGRGKYYLLYLTMGSLIAILVLTFLSVMFFTAAFPESVPYIAITAVVLVTIATTLTWAINEKRFKRIIQREIKAGKQKDLTEE